MDLFKIAEDTIKTTKEGKYEFNGREICLPDVDYSDVIIYSPEKGQEMLEEPVEFGTSMCTFKVVNEDSFAPARDMEKPMVMNFASAVNPGGGFLMGSVAQEEALCRCSTLYASLASDKAKEMYLFNRREKIDVFSDHMLFSRVCVFRDRNCNLIDNPYEVSVVTVAAPNKRRYASNVSDERINEVLKHRMRVMFRVAYENGCRSLVLGAWGCGVFGNNPVDVARCFREVLVDEKYGTLFKEVVFAVLGREDGMNITAFRDCFGALL